MNGVVVAQFGQVHPEVAAARKLRQDVYLAELIWSSCIRLGLRSVKFAPLGKYPAVERDFSFVFADEVSFEQMHRRRVAALGIAEVARVSSGRDFSRRVDCRRKIFHTVAGAISI